MKKYRIVFCWKHFCDFSHKKNAFFRAAVFAGFCSWIYNSGYRNEEVDLDTFQHAFLIKFLHFYMLEFFVKPTMIVSTLRHLYAIFVNSYKLIRDDTGYLPKMPIC